MADTDLQSEQGFINGLETRINPIQIEAEEPASSIGQLPQFGARLLQHFLFDPDYRNMNHGEDPVQPLP